MHAEDLRPRDGLEGRWILPFEPGVFRLLHGNDDDQSEICRALWRAAAETRRTVDEAPHGSGCISASRPGRGRAPDDLFAGIADADAQPLYRRRRGAKLRREWQGSANPAI